MTPLMIQILIHYYCTNVDFPNLNAPAVQDAIGYFVRIGLLYDRTKDDKITGDAEYQPNREALAVYICALELVPLPVQKWIIPEKPVTQTNDQTN